MTPALRWKNGLLVINLPNQSTPGLKTDAIFADRGEDWLHRMIETIQCLFGCTPANDVSVLTGLAQYDQSKKSSLTHTAR